MTSLSAQIRPVRTGMGEIVLYAFTMMLATGPLDRLIKEQALSSSVRAVAWALVYAAFLWIIASKHGTLRRSLRGLRPLLLLPALAFLSILWSDRPLDTAVGTSEMAAVILFGAVMGCRLEERYLLPLLVMVLTALAVVDGWVIATQPIGLDINGEAVGIFAHKNGNGQIMALLSLACFAILTWGGRRGLALLGLAIAVPILILSGSRTAWLVAIVGVAAILLLAFRRLKPAGRLIALFLGTALATATIIGMMRLQANLVDGVLSLLGKDSTLTGRTVLWDLATRYINEAPILGHGFNAFWSLDPTTDAAFVDSVLKEDLQSFHNGYLELANELGWVGAGIEILVMVAFLRPLGRLLRHGTPSVAAFALALLLVIAISNLSEVALFVRHGFNLLLLSALWSRAYSPTYDEARAPRIRLVTEAPR